ncbi:c-type cytochrome [Pseudobdellovibrio exovorus]|uniref:Cytochrome c domain-containing protein n=1 Tax=Pseudobdellovibrio exovorus JSS TaxID=1184267 RepID=M4VQS4_9BACT|nr:cytochrome c [Pseudobdellovibrio exovorus]AGH95494.1 hypothetical protein A11Q_1278 [Pseudobdellovibrio exovorus JSS]
MKYWVLVFILLSSLQVSAQQIIPLFRDNSLRTHVTMPFRLQDNSGNPISIFNLELTAGQNNCKAMVDPHISNNFLVKCKEPANIQVSVYFKANDQMNRINYGPVTINALSATGVIEPVTDNSNKYAVGKNLFNVHCMSCHQNPHEKPNRSFTQLKSALTNIGQMKSIRLTDEEIREISAYLNNLD